MYDFLNNCPEKDILIRFGQIAQNNNFKIYLAGGFVRDTLLNRQSKDYDIGVVGNALKFTEILEKELNVKSIIFERFGTSVINFQGNNYEFVGTRKELYEEQSRNPIITTGTMEDDINRRDFTINGMVYILNPNIEKKLIDLHNGRKDLESKLIRCIGNPEIVYTDDPLRMLRAIRFSCQLGFDIDEQSYNTIKFLKDRISIISTERIVVEFLKILETDRAVQGIDMLKECKLLEYILPEIIIDYNNSIENLNWISFKCKDSYLRLISLLINIDKRKVSKIYDRLKTSKIRKIQAIKILEMITIFETVLNEPDCFISHTLLIKYNEWIPDFLKLAKSLFLIDDKIPIEQSSKLEYIRIMYTLGIFSNINSIISGDFIMEKFKLQPGPKIKEIKNKIINSIISGKLIIMNIKDREKDIINYINENFEFLK